MCMQHLHDCYCDEPPIHTDTLNAPGLLLMCVEVHCVYVSDCEHSRSLIEPQTYTMAFTHIQSHTWASCRSYKAYAESCQMFLIQLFFFILTWMSRRLPRSGRSLQMRTAYFSHWENVALSPSLTTSSSPLCCQVSTLLNFKDIPLQSFILQGPRHIKLILKK